MDFMNDYIPIIVGTKLAFSENIFEYKRIIIFVVFCLKPFKLLLHDIKTESYGKSETFDIDFQ